MAVSDTLVLKELRLLLKLSLTQIVFLTADQD